MTDTILESAARIEAHIDYIAKCSPEDIMVLYCLLKIRRLSCTVEELDFKKEALKLVERTTRSCEEKTKNDRP